ncbi:hypothetical protein Tco_0024688 [Tanacetum coccineum]
MLSRLWMSWCRNGDDDAVDSVVGWGVVAVVKMAVEARGIVDRLDPVKRSIFEVGRRTRRKVIPAIGDGGRRRWPDMGGEGERWRVAKGGGLPHRKPSFAKGGEVKGWLDEDLEYYHLKELHYSAQCHTQMSLWIISRGVVLLILLMEYKFQVWYIELTSPSDHSNSRKNTRLSKQNLQSSSMTFIHKTLIIPSVLDSCFISSTVCEVKRVMILLYIKICAYDKKFSSRWTYTTMMLPRVRNHHGGKCVHLGLN